MNEALFVQIVHAGREAGLDELKAREIAERAVGLPERCAFRGIEADRCSRVAGHGGYHEWGTDEYRSVLTVREP